MAKKISGTLPPYLVMIQFFRWQNRISKPGFLFEEIVMVPGEVLRGLAKISPGSIPGTAVKTNAAPAVHP